MTHGNAAIAPRLRYGRGAIVLLALAVVLPAGCRSPSPNGRSDAPQRRSVVLTVTTDRAEYGPGETIAVTIAVRNAGGDTVTLEFPTTQRYDVELRDASGAAVWRWSADRAFGQAMGGESIRPEGALSYAVTVPAPSATGRYVVVGTVPALDAALEATALVAVR